MCCSAKLGPVQRLLPTLTREELLELRTELHKQRIHPNIEKQFKELLNET